MCRRTTNTARRGVRQSSVWRSREALSERRARERRRSGARPAPLVAAGAILGQTAARQPPHGRRAFRPLRLPARRQGCSERARAVSPPASPFPRLSRGTSGNAVLPEALISRQTPSARARGAARAPGAGWQPAALGARGWAGGGRLRSWQEQAVPPPSQQPVRARASLHRCQSLHQQLWFVGL